MGLGVNGCFVFDVNRLEHCSSLSLSSLLLSLLFYLRFRSHLIVSGSIKQTELDTTVHSCESPSEPSTNLFRVVLTDTVLFPEGGVYH